MKIRYLRGLPKDMGTGAMLRVRMEGIAYTTHPAIYEEPILSLETHDMHLDNVHLQRCIEHLATEADYPIEQVAQIAGVSEACVQKVLDAKPSFSTRWNQGFQILLADPREARLELELLPPSAHRGRDLLGKKSGASAMLLVEPYRVFGLTKLDGMTYEGIFRLERPKGARGAAADEQQEQQQQHLQEQTAPESWKEEWSKPLGAEPQIGPTDGHDPRERTKAEPDASALRPSQRAPPPDPVVPQGGDSNSLFTGLEKAATKSASLIRSATTSLERSSPASAKKFLHSATQSLEKVEQRGAALLHSATASLGKMEKGLEVAATGLLAAAPGTAVGLGGQHLEWSHRLLRPLDLAVELKLRAFQESSDYTAAGLGGRRMNVT